MTPGTLLNTLGNLGNLGWLELAQTGNMHVHWQFWQLQFNPLWSMTEVYFCHQNQKIKILDAIETL
jgi:hypothetical protein